MGWKNLGAEIVGEVVPCYVSCDETAFYVLVTPELHDLNNT